ncbi:MAG: hypothetical protein OEZ57_04850 [Nitrospirota bacterium]|nr:hypothetical protein [Nitrospirota bacterium]MDH5584998.1 hypothetical protein [Nitrospirota bacterium]MDH5774225.1 hypothetical protein [Nitrospirota bacterium]
MNKFTLLFPLIVLGLVSGVQDVRAQNTQNADLHPPYLAEEELEVQGGGEEPILEDGEEGEVTERGVRRFRLKPRKRITIPQQPTRPRITIPNSQLTKPRIPIRRPQTKKPPSPPPTGGTKDPLGENDGSQGQPVSPPASQCVVKTSDIVFDPQIDIGDNDGSGESAKQSLLRMLSHGTVEQRRAASGMVQAIKSQRLAGIFQWNKQAVSVRSQALTPPRGPWDLIPKGQLSTCLREPIGDAPMIIYSRQPMHPSMLDQALVIAWGQCGLPTPNSPCQYVGDMGNKPQPTETVGEASLTVQVLSPNGVPSSGAIVKLSGPISSEQTASQIGEATFIGIPNGEYVIQAFNMDAGTNPIQGAGKVSVNSQVTTAPTLRVFLNDGGKGNVIEASLTVKVVWADGDPSESAIVELSGPMNAKQTASQNGEVAFVGIPDGIYIIRAFNLDGGTNPVGGQAHVTVNSQLNKSPTTRIVINSPNPHSS